MASTTYARRLATVILLAVTACGQDAGGGGGDAGAVLDGDGGDPAPLDAAAAVDCTERPATAPDTRGEVAGVLDEERGRILAYGGNTAAPEMCRPAYELVDELWAFHLDCNSWERLETSGGPGVRARHAAAVDTARGRMLLFGGRERLGSGDYQNFGDVWALDLATDTWSEITTAGEGPSPRSSAVIAYDAAKDRMLVFGGNTSTGGLTLTGIGDMFALDLATGQWSEITAPDAPSPRLYHAATTLGHEWLIFGGTPDYDGPYHNDVHAFDMTTDRWRMVSGGGPGAPVTRFGAGIMADPERNRLILVGGHDGTDMGNRNDMWALDVEGGAWAELHAGDTLTGRASGPCMFPADFTTPEEGAPERRYSFLYTASRTRGYLFGGKTDCGNTNDVWAVDYETDQWAPLRASTGGIACNRSGSTTCSSLCF